MTIPAAGRKGNTLGQPGGRLMRGKIRAAILAILAAFTAGEGSVAQAQGFPSRPVTLIVPWPAGGTTDIAMRALAGATQKHLGQSIVIENRPGVAGALGPMHMAATATPDGHTISQIPLSLLRAAFLTKMTFDPTGELTYIIGLTGYTFGVVVQHDSSWNSFQELLTDAKARPGTIRYGSPGGGTTPHMTMVQIARRQNINWIHIPFKGSSEVTNAILGGHIDAVADGTSWGPMVNAGELRLLVTWGAHRTTNWPSVPTLNEIGIDLVANAPYGLAGPKGMDPKIVAILHDAFKKGMAEPSYVSALRQLDQVPF